MEVWASVFAGAGNEQLSALRLRFRDLGFRALDKMMGSPEGVDVVVDYPGHLRREAGKL